MAKALFGRRPAAVKPPTARRATIGMGDLQRADSTPQQPKQSIFQKTRAALAPVGAAIQNEIERARIGRQRQQDVYNVMIQQRANAPKNSWGMVDPMRRTSPGMGDVRKVDQQQQTNTRAQQADAGRYMAALRQSFMVPDMQAAQKYMGYGSPSYGLTYAKVPGQSGSSGASASGKGYGKPYNPRGGYGGGGGGGYGWDDWGGGGGGGGGGYTQTPEWYERMLSWKF